MYLWIIVAIVAIIFLAFIGMRVAKILWVTNFIAVYNMKLSETKSRKEALRGVIRFYSERPPFHVLSEMDIDTIAEAFEPIPRHEQILGRLFLELDRKRDARVLTDPVQVAKMARVAKRTFYKPQTRPL